MPFWLTILLSALLPLVIGLAVVLAIMAAAKARRQRALCDPSVDPGAATFGQDRQELLQQILSCAQPHDPSPPLSDSSANHTEYAEPLSPPIALQEGWAIVEMYRGDLAQLLKAARFFGQAIASSPMALAGIAETALHACAVEPPLYSRAGLRQALPVMHQALKMMEDGGGGQGNDGHQLKAELWSLRAQYALHLGLLDECASVIDQLPDRYWRCHLVRGSLYALRKKTERAAKELEQAITLAPVARQPVLLAMQGQVWASRKKFRDLAVAAFLKAVALDPHYAWAWHYLAVELYKSRRFPEALKASDQALAHQQNIALVVHQLNQHLRRRLAKDWAPEGA